MKLFRVCSLLLVSASLFILTGCTAKPASSNKMVASAGPEITAKIKQSKFHKKLEVGDVGGGSKTNPMFASKVASEDFKDALQYSLGQTQFIYPDDAPKYKLNAHLVHLKQPPIGINFTVKSRVHYSITDNDTEETVFDKMIDGVHTARFNEAFYGVTRLRLASEGSMKNNIEELLNSLSEETS